jgi:DNA-binding IclR family transcriptional regulator
MGQEQRGTMQKEEPVKGKSVGAVHNALRILRYVTDLGAPAGVNQISRATGVSVSTCFNILGTLLSEGLVSFDDSAKSYAPGMGLLGLAAPLLGANPIELATPEIEALSQKHNSLICLWNVTADERIVLANRASSSRTVRVDMNYGARLPAYAGAVGRCYAGVRHLSDKELRAAFDKLNWQKPPSFDEYRADVLEARRTGYAFDFGNLFNGLEIAAAVVTDRMGRARYGLSGISIAGQLSREEIMGLALDLKQAADWFGRNLFANGKTVAPRR